LLRKLRMTGAEIALCLAMRARRFLPSCSGSGWAS
jgi:hypothetical protein